MISTTYGIYYHSSEIVLVTAVSRGLAAAVHGATAACSGATSQGYYVVVLRGMLVFHSMSHVRSTFFSIFFFKNAFSKM